MQLLYRKSNRRSGVLVSPDHSTVVDPTQCPLITQIRVTNIFTQPRHIPAGDEVYVAVKSENGTYRTSSKPAEVGKNIVRWNDEILLPPVHSSKISFTVLASSESESTLGVREPLRAIEVTVGELLDRSSKSEFVRLLEQDNRDLEIGIRRPGGPSEHTPLANSFAQPTASVEKPKIEGLMDISYRAFSRCFQLLKHCTQWIFNPRLLELPPTLFCLLLVGVTSLIDRDKGISVLEVIVRYTSDGHSYKPSWLDLLADFLRDRYEDSGDAMDLERSLALEEHALRLTPDDDPEKSEFLVGLAMALLSRYERFGDVADLEKSISLKEDAVRLTPDSDPDKPARLASLAVSLSSRYERFGDIMDLEKSISSEQSVLQLTPDGHSAKSTRLVNLAMSLWSRYERRGDIADLARSISLKEDALRLTPDGDPDHPEILASLAISLLSRYERFGDIADLEKSISLEEEALRLTPDDYPDKRTQLGNLAVSLSKRYECFGDIIDLEKSITLEQNVLQLTPDDHPDKPMCLVNLAMSSWKRYERFGDIIDLEKSISLKEDALQLTPDDHPSKATQLANLAESFSGRYKRFGDITDLEKSILLKEDALKLSPGDHPDKPGILAGLEILLLSRYERFGDIADLEKSISLKENTLEFTPNDHPDKPAQLNNLATLLSSRYEVLGDIADLEKSMYLVQNAVWLTPDDHPDKLTRLANLAMSFWTRYQHFGDVMDLEQSISLKEDALQLTPGDHPNKPTHLVNLAASFSSRYERLGDIVDLERSISLNEDALRLTPGDHPDKPQRVVNLAVSLSSRYEHSGGVVDLEKSISLKTEALRLTPGNHPDKPTRLVSLAVSLLSRYERSRDIIDLEKSISLEEDAVQLTPDGHPDMPLFLNNTALSLILRSQHFGAASISDLHQAISYTSRATRCYTGQPSVRFQSSQLSTWIKCLRVIPQENQSLFDAYTVAIDILPHLAWIGSTFQDRYHRLLEAAGLVPDAAAVALDVHKPEIAVEWLEQCRSVVWSQVSQLRTPVEDLRSKDLALATQFQHVSRALERAGVRTKEDEIHSSTHHLTMTNGTLKTQAHQHHELGLARERLLTEIRALPHFQRFLLPTEICQLYSWACTGHVILLNASTRRCDALVVIGHLKQVIHIPLSQTNLGDIVNMQGQLNNLLLNKDLRDETETDRGARLVRLGADDMFKSILSDLWNKVVSPILDVLCLSTPPANLNLPRIFWCPIGPFTFLPIHAAGIYGTNNRGYKLSDFAVSSYIPTMNSLREQPQKDSQMSSGEICMLGVPQPSTDGARQLKGVEMEMGFIRKLTSSSPLVDFKEADGTVEDTLAKMKKSDWVHFCCHGTQDRTNPLDSGLLLADRKRLKLSDIAQLSRPRGGLAVLSACQTAVGDEQLSDEAIHLAAGMLLAGYSGVVATMWSIMDSDAPRVVKDFYADLFGGGRIPDSRRAAEALHHAIEKLRDSGAPFSSWVPFVHYGL